MIRQFIELAADGTVRADLEIERASFAGVEIPPALIEVTGHEQWKGLGSLIGYRRELDGRFTAPPPKPAIVDLRAFFRLFTQAEVLAIAARRATDPEIEYFWVLLTLGPHVDLGHADTAGGLDLLVAKGLLTAERRLAVLANAAPVGRA